MSSFDKTTPRLGFIYGNRGFFPDPLVTEARMDLARLWKDVSHPASNDFAEALSNYLGWEVDQHSPLLD
jgi:hypothetical protein